MGRVYSEDLGKNLNMNFLVWYYEYVFKYGVLRCKKLKYKFRKESVFLCLSGIKGRYIVKMIRF